MARYKLNQSNNIEGHALIKQMTAGRQINRFELDSVVNLYMYNSSG